MLLCPCRYQPHDLVTPTLSEYVQHVRPFLTLARGNRDTLAELFKPLPNRLGNTYECRLIVCVRHH